MFGRMLSGYGLLIQIGGMGLPRVRELCFAIAAFVVDDVSNHRAT